MAKYKSSQVNIDSFVSFLLEAKRNTYAAQDVSVVRKSPLIAGSTQLEWAKGDWLYRDIYFGSSQFTGIETVFEKNQPYWSMCYSGGLCDGVKSDEASDIYAVLKNALKSIPYDKPFRGPEKYIQGNFIYQSFAIGEPDKFTGTEEIFDDGVCKYSLSYAGGFIA